MRIFKCHKKLIFRYFDEIEIFKTLVKAKNIKIKFEMFKKKGK